MSFQRTSDRAGKAKEKSVYWSILLAFGLWYGMFVWRPFNFWLMMSLSTSLLILISCCYGHPLLQKSELTGRNILLGIFSAVVLYFLFWVGNHVLIFIADFFPRMLPDRSGNLNAVYANMGELSPVLVGALLFFPIGFGEEIFWRGFVQRHFSRRWSGRTAFIVTTLLYTCVHLPTGNPVLILAALTVGLFWGGLYWATGSILPVLVSHMLWDPAIFVVWPIR
ncbi:MAG: type II CAAX endopeptidase family protein [Pseudomonadota bacterium]